MKIRKSLAGAALVLLGLAGGGVAVAASMASADTSPAGSTTGTDAPEIGPVGQTGTTPPAGVTLEKGEAATPAK